MIDRHPIVEAVLLIIVQHFVRLIGRKIRRDIPKRTAISKNGPRKTSVVMDTVRSDQISFFPACFYCRPREQQAIIIWLWVNLVGIDLIMIGVFPRRGGIVTGVVE